MGNSLSRHASHRSCFASCWQKMKTPSSARLGADAASLFSDSGLRGSGSSGSARANNSSTSNNNSNISSSNSKLLEKLQQSSSFVRKKVETIRKKTKAVDSWVGPKLKDLWRASCCSSARLLQQVDGYQPSQRAAEAALAAYQRRSSTRSSDDVAFQGMDYTLYTINEVDCPGDSEVVIARLRSLAAGMKSNKVDSPNLEAPELDVKELDVGEFSMITPTMELKPEALPEVLDVTGGTPSPTPPCSTGDTEGTLVSTATKGFDLDTETKLFLLTFGVLASTLLPSFVLFALS